MDRLLAIVLCFGRFLIWEENLRRNAGRTAMVTPGVIEHMLSKVEMPYLHEADIVEWKCV